MTLKLGHKILLLISIPLAFILIAIAVLAAVQQSTTRAERLSNHSVLVLDRVRSLSKSMSDAEDDQRGYLLTKDPAFLVRTRHTMASIPAQLAALEELVSDNPSQEAASRVMRSLAIARLDLMGKTLSAASAGTTIGPRVLADVRAGTVSMDEFVRRMQTFTDEEVRLQHERDEALGRSIALLNWVLGLSAVVVVLLTLAVMRIFSRGTAARISALADKAHRIANELPLGTEAAASNDEIASVDRAFHQMAHSIGERQALLMRYRLLAEHSRDIILFVRRSDTRIVDANRAAVAAYGYSREELLQLTVPDLRVPEERDVVAKQIEGTDRGAVFYESRHRRKDGTSFPVEVTGQAADFGGERLLVSIVRDVSDRKRAEQERDRFFEASLDMMCVASFGGYFIRLNESWERTLGYTRHELKAIPFIEMVHPDDVEATASAMRALTEGKTVVGFENRYRRKDGVYLWFSWSAIPSLDDGLIFAVARDVTERKHKDEELARSRDQANEASRVKSEFLANMSHEIRTPMNGIIGTTALLRSMALNPEQREYVEIIAESGEALLAIINQILDLSKLEAGKVSREEVDFSPVSVVESVSMLFAPAAAAKGLSIQSFVAPDVMPTLRGDPGLLRQILVNLTGNAVKFTESGGVLINVERVRSGSSDAVLRFSVSDTGIGVLDGDYERLFEPFSQADTSTTRKYGGTGLGLSISKGLAELMGGEIGAQPNEEGGTTFWFTARFSRPAAALEKAPRDAFSGVRVLVADPDAVSRDILHRYMFNWGMRNGIVAATAAEALACLRDAALNSDPYGLAFVAAEIANEEHGTFAREVAADPKLSATRLILIKGISGEPSGVTPQPGFAYFLTKPIRQSYLFDCIAAALHRTPDKQSEGEAPATRPQGQPLSGRVLVAEDNEINRRLAAAQFKRLGIDADFVENGRDAVAAVAQGAHALVFMDCQMPVMDGFEATRAIRMAEQRTGAHLPIVAMTANAMEGDRETCLARGMDDYMSKPVDIERLGAVVERWLGLPADSPPAAHNGASDTPLDLTRLRGVFGDDREAIVSLLRATAEESTSVFARLRKALDARDGRAVAQAAHELKGFMANVGAARVADIAGRIEGSVSNGTCDVAESDSDELGAAIDRVVEFARSTIERHENGSAP